MVTTPAQIDVDITSLGRAVSLYRHVGNNQHVFYFYLAPTWHMPKQDPGFDKHAYWALYVLLKPTDPAVLDSYPSAGSLHPYGSKYPNRRYLPQATMTISKMRALSALHLGTLEP